MDEYNDYISFNCDVEPNDFLRIIKLSNDRLSIEVEPNEDSEQIVILSYEDAIKLRDFLNANYS